jgi:hypothetical protein
VGCSPLPASTGNESQKIGIIQRMAASLAHIVANKLQFQKISNKPTSITDAVDHVLILLLGNKFLHFEVQLPQVDV